MIKRIASNAIAAVIVLCIPLLAMQFTDEVSWTFFDFLVVGVLLLGASLAFYFVLKRVKNTIYRIVICLAILVILVLIWAELAVGIFGTPISGT